MDPPREVEELEYTASNQISTTDQSNSEAEDHEEGNAEEHYTAASNAEEDFVEEGNAEEYDAEEEDFEDDNLEGSEEMAEEKLSKPVVEVSKKVTNKKPNSNSQRRQVKPKATTSKPPAKGPELSTTVPGQIYGTDDIRTIEDILDEQAHLHDRQRESREKFTETAKVFREEVKEMLGTSNSPRAYDFKCQSRENTPTGSSEPKTLSDSKSLPFSVGGKSYNMDDPRTLSEIFREKFGEESAARVYGFSTESLDYLKAHPEFVTSGPNPMKIPHNEILGILDGFSNVYLAHEISINPDFRLERSVQPEDSMSFRVQEQMKKAFWDIFDENLSENPPNYNQALSVFGELKESLLSLLLPHNHQMRHRINTLLEVRKIREAVNNETFTRADFQCHSDFIIETLGQLCCPSRDQDIAALRELQKPSQVFRGVMEVMDKMKLDMANFFVMQFRANITTHCVQNERKKLADYMEVEYRLNSDGLGATRKWLQRHNVLDRDPGLAQAKAFGELLNYNGNEPFPEVLLLDVQRCVEMSHSVFRLSIIGATILTVSALAQTFFTPLPFDFRSIFKKHMLLIMSPEDMKDKKKFGECIEKAAEQAVFIVNEMTKKVSERRLEPEEKETVRTCVRDVIRPDHKIRSLLARRIVDHAEEVALTRKDQTITVPSGLNTITRELTVTLAEFQRLMSHNRRAFSDIYAGILGNELRPPTFPTKPDDPWDPNYLQTIEMLRKPIMNENISEERLTGSVRRKH